MDDNRIETPNPRMYMPTKLTDRLEFVSTILAVICVLIFLVLALVRLNGLGSSDPGSEDLRAATLIGQIQLDVQQLAQTAERKESYATLRQWEVIQRRVEPLALESNPVLAKFSAPVSEWMTQAELLVRRLARADLSIDEAWPTIRVRASQFIFLLRTMQSELLATAEQSAEHRRAEFAIAVLGIIVCIAASLLCAGFIIMRLLHSLHRTRQAEKIVRMERDALEDRVRERTQDLVHAETQLRNAINTAPDGFAAFDAKGDLIVANDLARRLMPNAGDLMVPGTPMAAILAAADTVMAPISTDDGVFVHMAELEMPNDNWVMMTLRRSSDGSAVMRLADITPYKAATKTLETALAREQNLRRLYKDFVAMVSHQFRTPLAIIDSAAQKILRHGRGAEWEEIAERAQQIRGATGGLAQLVDGSLDSGRMESGEMAFNPVETDLESLVEILCSRLAEVHADHRIATDLAVLPDFVRCDPMLIEHAVGNLVANAAKYSPRGGTISINARVMSHSVSIIVRDEGLGIPRDELALVFEPSYRASNAGGVAGTGIGLHVARKIMRLHGGDVVADSQLGIGTSIMLTLPFEQRRSLP